MPIPAKLIGYGAYNLCFDRLLGKKLNPGPADPDFFTYVSTKYPGVNLVKVICFRKSTLEGCPPDRAVPLYIRYREPPESGIGPGTIVIEFNDEFTQNLIRLVDRARACNMWVQVCIFHQHAASLKEQPEILPPPLAKTLVGATPCERLTAFFNPAPSAALEEQKEIVRRIGSALRGKTNVLWELANEVRIEGCGAHDAPRNCLLVKWLNLMKTELISAAGFGPGAVLTTSTGVGNEAVTFSPNRAAVGCSNPALAAGYFDFHSGQWGWNANFAAGIQAARGRASSYTPGAFLLVNDDGARLVDEDPNDPVRDQQLKRAAARTINHWAFEALKQGAHFTSKQQYPPARPYDIPALEALRDAGRGVRWP